uniref:Uncharacterized protein n=1 Tax=Chenopodium quinoa TaxID=63459 RepID=A0A803MI00_CHEQI
MRLLSSFQHVPYGVGGFELLGSVGGMLALLGLMVMSVSIISMLVFACADDGEDNREKHRKSGGRNRTSGGFFFGGDGGGGC